MANNRLVFNGLEELRAALRQLPEDLKAEAGAIVTETADAAKAEIIAAYPVRTGNLRNHVTVARASGSGLFQVKAVVKNTAKHAWIFENGTQARHTELGANRGSMPAGHVFLPIVMRKRRAMYERLKDLLTRHGLLVSGEAA